MCIPRIHSVSYVYRRFHYSGNVPSSCAIKTEAIIEVSGLETIICDVKG